MDKLVIQGGAPLQGTLHVGGSKNTALPLMAAAVLADGVTTIHNIPVLKDVATFSNVIRVTGCTIDWSPDDDPNTPETITIDAAYVRERLDDLARDTDLSKYIL